MLGKIILASLLMLMGAGCAHPMYRIDRADNKEGGWFVEEFKEYEGNGKKCVIFIVNSTEKTWCGAYTITKFDELKR